jgi:hypothetical protein
VVRRSEQAEKAAIARSATHISLQLGVGAWLFSLDISDALG